MLTPCRSPKCARLPDDLPCASFAGVVRKLNRLEDQRERGEEGPILHEVALDRRRVLAASEPRLELGTPAVEDLLRLGVEPNVRDLAVLVGVRPESLGTEVGEIFKNVIRSILGLE